MALFETACLIKFKMVMVGHEKVMLWLKLPVFEFYNTDSNTMSCQKGTCTIKMKKLCLRAWQVKAENLSKTCSLKPETILWILWRWHPEGHREILSLRECSPGTWGLRKILTCNLIWNWYEHSRKIGTWEFSRETVCCIVHCQMSPL